MSKEDSAESGVKIWAKYGADDAVDNVPEGDGSVDDFIMTESDTKAKVGIIIAAILSCVWLVCAVLFVIFVIGYFTRTDCDGGRYSVTNLFQNAGSSVKALAGFGLIFTGFVLFVIMVVKIIKRFRYKNIDRLPRLVSIYALVLFSFVFPIIGVYVLKSAFYTKSVIHEKPVIYAYNYTGDLDVKVNLNDADFLCTYPNYKYGWHVKASKDGKLTEGKNKYDYLYYEAISDKSFSIDEGFCVKKEDTVRFLEEKLTYLGLNDREREDFITYWLPALSKNNYNVISFKQDEYEDIAKLTVSPKADKIIRVYMVFKGGDDFIDISAQHLKEVKRNDGEKLIVEWGGTNLSV